jgi:hypothetical protein
MARRKEYTKTAAHWQGLINGGSLWLGADHVLSVRSMRLLEEYKRFYYRDIQALLVRQGPRWWYPSWLWFVFAILLAVSFFLTLMRRFALAGPCEAALFATSCVVLYQSLTRGCYCYVVTAVATVELTGVRTRSAARKAKAAMMERIAAAQGALPEGWQERLPTGNDETVAQKVPLVIDREPAAALPAVGVWAAVTAIFCTTMDGVLSFGQMRHWRVPDGVGMINVLAGVVAAVAAVVLLRQRGSFNWLRNAALLCVLMMGSATYTAYILGNMIRALPPSTRVTLGVVQHGVGVVNVTGDLVMVGVAVVLWLRQRSRTALPTNHPAVSTGEV